jgi:hypothetical protein
MRKEFFLSIFNTRIHLSRRKGLIKVTCFDEQDQVLGLNHEAHSLVIYKYLVNEGFISEEEEVKFSFCENME